MFNSKHCEICGKTIHKLPKKMLNKMAKEFVSKMIVTSLNDGSFLKPLKKYGITPDNFAHHLDIIRPYIEALEEQAKKGS